MVPIFAGGGAATFAQRLAEGRRSVLFRHHADYAAMTSGASTPQQVLAASRHAAHYLLDSRLLEAWAKALEASGDEARASYLAARLREFRREDVDGFFGPCDDLPEEEDEDADPADAAVHAEAGEARPRPGAAPAGADLPARCLEAPPGIDFRDFR